MSCGFSYRSIGPGVPYLFIFFFLVDVRVVCFDHRKSVYSRLPTVEDCPEEVTFHVDLGKSSSRAVYDYFSDKLADVESTNVSGG